MFAFYEKSGIMNSSCVLTIGRFVHLLRKLYKNLWFAMYNSRRALIMKGQMDTQYGKVLIDESVIATYAGSVAVECFGIVGMAAVNMRDGLVKLLKKEHLRHGINVTVDEDNEITIDFHVIVVYGVCINTVADNLIETVKYKVETFTGMQIKRINIDVQGVRVID